MSLNKLAIGATADPAEVGGGGTGNDEKIKDALNAISNRDRKHRWAPYSRTFHVENMSTMSCEWSGETDVSDVLWSPGLKTAKINDVIRIGGYAYETTMFLGGSIYIEGVYDGDADAVSTGWTIELSMRKTTSKNPTTDSDDKWVYLVNPQKVSQDQTVVKANTPMFVDLPPAISAIKTGEYWWIEGKPLDADGVLNSAMAGGSEKPLGWVQATIHTRWARLLS